MIVVVSGPGGVGKGTVVKRLIERDPSLWLSRSWTTRDPRPGEDPHAYVFVDEPAFRERIDQGGFLEWARFIDHLYGTPVPGPEAGGRDLLLEIEVQGARQVLEREPEALLILLVAPDPEAQRARLEGRGDPPEQVAGRLAKAAEEVAEARALGALEVVNDELETTVDRLQSIIASAREARAGS